MIWLCSIFTTQSIQIMHNPDDKPSNCFILLTFSNLFNFHAIHECDPWIYHYRWNRIWWWRLCGEDKKEESLTSTRLINGLWRCPSIDVNARSRDCHATDALRAISVWKLNKETKWVCIQLACSWRPRALRKPIVGIYKAKFYNTKFPLVYESDNIGDSLYEEHGATLKHKCGKR